MLRISPLNLAAISALQVLADEQSIRRKRTDLQALLTDEAHAGGKHASVAWLDDRPVGCVGWVTLGVKHDGRLYGSPLIANDVSVAERLIEILDSVGNNIDASHLRVSSWDGEPEKTRALVANGFVSLFEWVTLALEIEQQTEIRQSLPPEGLASVSPDQIDWQRASELYGSCFRGIPNAPKMEPGDLATEWAGADWDVSRVLKDPNGNYVAFLINEAEGAIDSVGVDKNWRRKGIASWLYRQAAETLARKAVPSMTVLIANLNTASMRLHHKLGFLESAPRGIVWERACHRR